MKKYELPTLEVILISETDIITASLGTETPTLDENDGEWDIFPS